MKVILTRPIEGPSVPELGLPTSTSFDSMTVPLNRASTSIYPLSKYEIERSLAPGGPWTVQASGLSIFGNPATAYVAGGLLASTAYYWRARAFDISGRISAYCTVVLATTSAASTGQFKTNYGNHLVLTTDHSLLDQTRVNQIKSDIDTFLAATITPSRTPRAGFGGVTIKIQSRDLCRVKGDDSYSAPFIQQILDHLALFTPTQTLGIVAHDRTFGDSLNNVTGSPYYASDCPFYSTFSGDGGYNGDYGNGLNSVMQLDNPVTIEWMCRMHEALAARWDNHSQVIRFSTEGESATPEPHILQSYEQRFAANWGAVHNGLKTVHQRARAAWVHTPLKAWYNHYYDETSFPFTSQNSNGVSYPWSIHDLAANMATYNIMAGPPDPELPVPITGTEPTGMGGPGGGQYIGMIEVWRGRKQQNGTYVSGGIDYRLTTGSCLSVEGYGMQIDPPGTGYSFPIAAIGDQFKNVNKAYYIDFSLVQLNQPYYTAQQDFFTGLVPYLAGGGGAPFTTAKPSNWP